LRESSLEVALFRVSTCAMNSSLENAKSPRREQRTRGSVASTTVAVYTVSQCAS
jgi:hypothetical protein